MSKAHSGFTAEQLDQLYDRLKIVAGIAVKRNAILVINPKQQSFMQDMIERMVEDTEFKLVYGAPPHVMVHEKAQEGEIRFSIPGKEGLLSIQQLVNAETGYGRYNSINLPSSAEDMRPWGKQG